jgi:hypothetical protein
MAGPHSVVLKATVNKYYRFTLTEFDVSKLGTVGGDPALQCALPAVRQFRNAKNKLIRGGNQQLYSITSPAIEKITPRGMVKSSTSGQPFFCDRDYYYETPRQIVQCAFHVRLRTWLDLTVENNG